MKRQTLAGLRLAAGALVVLLGFLIYRDMSLNGIKPGPAVEDFALLDQDGQFHQLYYYSDMKAIVFIVQGNGCPIFRQSIPYIRALKEQYGPRGVAFFMINANPQDDRASIDQEAREFKMNMPVLKDESGIVAESLQLTRTAEAIVIDPVSWSIIYRGAINDQLGYEIQKTSPRHHYLRDAIENFLAGRRIRVTGGPVRGCLIALENKDPDITYTKDVAPVLAQHCVICHSPGGVAPWSMDNYHKVAGWAPMIREVVRTKRMPPWHADPYYGKWKDDLSFSPEEAWTLIRWIEGGLKRGGGEDPLPPLMLSRRSEWSLGEPDILLRLKEEQEIPATGLDQFRELEVDQIIDKDLWVKAVEIRPGNPRAVHHANIVVSWSDPDPAARAAGVPADSSNSLDKEKWYQLSGLSMETGDVIAGYSPGNGPLILPEDTGIFIPGGSHLVFRIHYIPTGKIEKDLTKAGLYLHSSRPAHVYSVETIVNRSLKIPAGEKNYRVSGDHTFNEEIVLTAIQPHMHYRGKSMKFTAEYPDGKKETLLSVPNYKFRWQRSYMFKSPRKIPAGTRIVVEGVYDNSARNPDNPDPSKDVLYGPESDKEMFTGILYYIKPN